MTEEIDAFIDYLQQVKKSSVNTTMSYRRDLTQLWEYLKQQGIDEPSRVTKTSLNSYILYLEGQGKASTTISRVVASMKSFFHYEMIQGNIRRIRRVFKNPEDRKESAGFFDRRGGRPLFTAAQRRFSQGDSGQSYAGAFICYRYSGFRADWADYGGCESGSRLYYLPGRTERADDSLWQSGRRILEALPGYSSGTAAEGKGISLAVYQLQRQSHVTSGLLEDRKVLRARRPGLRQILLPTLCAIPLQPI